MSRLTLPEALALPSPTPHVSRDPSLNSSEFLHNDNLVSQPDTHGLNVGIRPESGIGGYAAGASVGGYASNLDAPHIPSNILFVDGLPSDCSPREVAHIFRPFFGFREIKLLHREPRTREDKPMVLCFVAFSDAACALTALKALQGYKFDNTKPNSRALKIHFASFPFKHPSDGVEQRRAVKSASPSLSTNTCSGVLPGSYSMAIVCAGGFEKTEFQIDL